jgi:hypothetical protein
MCARRVRLQLVVHSADFLVCCIAAFQSCVRVERQPIWEIGDTAGLENLRYK